MTVPQRRSVLEPPEIVAAKPIDLRLRGDFLPWLAAINAKSELTFARITTRERVKVISAAMLGGLRRTD